MLVLSRKKYESIRIGDDIEITVLEVRGGRVRLGIAAPNDVRVMRHELLPREIDPVANAAPGTSSSDDPGSIVSRADAPIQSDTLRSGNGRNHTNGNHTSTAGS